MKTDYTFKLKTGYFDDIKLSKLLLYSAKKKGFPITYNDKSKYFFGDNELKPTHLTLREWFHYEHGIRLIINPVFEEEKYYGYIYNVKFDDETDETNLNGEQIKRDIELTGLTFKEISTKGLQVLLDLTPHFEN